MKSKTINKIIIIGFLLPGLFMIAITLYYPAIDGVIMSFQDVKSYDLFSKEFIGLENYIKLFSNRSYWTSWINTFWWVGICVCTELVLGFVVALLLQKSFPGKRAYESVVFMPWALSGFMVGIMWKWMFNGSSGVINDILIRLGLVDKPIGFLSNPETALPSVMVAKVWTGMAFFAIIIMAALKTIPKEMYEAASIDGANGIQKFFYITIPGIRSIVVLMVLLRAIQTINSPDLIFGMTQGGPAGTSHIVSSYVMTEVVSGKDYGLASAGGVTLWIFTLLCTGIYLMVTKAFKGGDE